MAISSTIAGARSREVYEIIKGKILSQELKRGQRISERGLARELGVARATLRDSLVYFIEKIPGVGSFVKSHQTEEVIESLEVRQLLEGHAAKRAAENITASRAEALTMLVDALEAAFQNDDGNSLNQHDIDLHMKIADFSGNSALKELIRQGQTVRYLLLRGNTSETTGYAAAVQEHKEIVAAIVEGNSEAAEKRMRDHLHKGIDRFWASIRKRAIP